MTHDTRHLPVPRSLLGRPQRLGLLPTMWFWNDRVRQRLILPLISVTGIPLGIVLLYVTARLHLNGWLPSAFTVLYPLLIMGLVERRIRRELRERPPEALAVATSAPSKPLGRTLPASLAVLALTVSLMVSLGASGALILMVIGVLLGGTAALFLFPQTRRALTRLAGPDHDTQTGLPPALDDR